MWKKIVCKKNYLRKAKKVSTCYGSGGHVYQFAEKNEYVSKQSF